ncbi:MAG TPA: sigma-70 family RNA polymerase sigma factor [Polyangia bacterium]|jgi:RNA polymerase sigma-70 factor (ECF subfamily)|nr:sigma-70 family RNA polymerase sigma factor [Polyangia bacterium]
MTTSEKPTEPPPATTATTAAGTARADGAAPGAVDQANAESDLALVERARNKDYAAFEQLLARYEDKVFRLAYRFVRNESEAKEILQDTFLAIWRKLDTFKGDSQFSSWVYRVAANAALMRLRSQRRHPEVSTEELPAGFLDQQQYGQILSPGENWARRPDEELQSEEVRQHIQAAVDALPEIYRTVFLVRDVEGLSTEETAELLGISVPTVKTRLHRARMALRETITAYFDKK